MTEPDYSQIALHDKWKKDPASYQKPPTKGPHEKVPSCLVNAKDIRDEFSYILFVDSEIKRTWGCAAQEFLNQDPDHLRAASLKMKNRPGFHVYYKQGPYWYGVAEHFADLADAFPFIHSGLRVLVEYRFSVQSVRYMVCSGFETGPNKEQGKYRRPDELCALYGVDPKDCIFELYAGYLPPSGPLIVLRPLWQQEWNKDNDKREDYKLQRDYLRNFGTLAPTK